MKSFQSKLVISLQGSPPRHCAQATQILLKNAVAVASRQQHVYNLTGPKFEPQTFRSKNERVIARPTDR